MTVGGQERKLGTSDAFRIDIEAFDAKGKPVQQLPAKGGYFQLKLPSALLADRPISLVMQWIDFHR